MSDEQLAAARPQGRSAAAIDDDAFELWEQHQQAARLFAAMRTQWRVAVGMGGLHYEGLDYGALPHVERRLGLAEGDGETFRQLQVMELAARRRLNGDP